MYYLQSRYYDPEIGRFINADAFASTGQGILGNNMFAYCGNNPVNGYDPTGTISYRSYSDDAELFERMLEGGAGGLVGGVILYAGTQLISTVAEDEKLTTKYGTSDDSNGYTVYFLCKSGDASRTIVNVGRVITENFGSRMNYHKTRGRTHVYSISGINYSQCRAIEQLGMVYYHTINRGDQMNNQIRGIRPTNGNREQYIYEMFRYLRGCSGDIFAIIPQEYIYNLTLNEFLNIGQ